MSSRIMFTAAIALVALAAPAFAGDNEDRAAAMAACKKAVAEQLSLDVDGMRLDARKDGQRVSFAQCTYVRRSGETNVVVATPPAQQNATN